MILLRFAGHGEPASLHADSAVFFARTVSSREIAVRAPGGGWIDAADARQVAGAS